MVYRSYASTVFDDSFDICNTVDCNDESSGFAGL